jgi:hypothetical protein
MTEYDFLVEIKNILSAIPTVKSCYIGLERGINAKDVPFIRIVPIRSFPKNGETFIHFQVVIGFDKKNKEYEKLHEDYYNLANRVREEMIKKQCKWLETVTDEDMVTNLKTAIIVFEGSICNG